MSRQTTRSRFGPEQRSRPPEHRARRNHTFAPHTLQFRCHPGAVHGHSEIQVLQDTVYEDPAASRTGPLAGTVLRRRYGERLCGIDGKTLLPIAGEVEDPFELTRRDRSVDGGCRQMWVDELGAGQDGGRIAVIRSGRLCGGQLERPGDGTPRRLCVRIRELSNRPGCGIVFRMEANVENGGRPGLGPH
jgi:hypothetical protein